MRLHNTTDPYKIDQKEIAENFIEWWQTRSNGDGGGRPGMSPDEFFEDPTLVERIFVDKDGTISTPHRIYLTDDRCKMLPFKFGKVGGFKLDMPNLKTLKGAPLETQQFGIETLRNHIGDNNKFINSMVGCPQICKHMVFELDQPLESLQTSCKSPIDSLWIHTPEIKSFAGLNVPVGELTFTLLDQKSITGIHKQLRNIEDLLLILPPNFEGGLMGVTMIPGIKNVGAGGSASQASQALTLIGKLMRKKTNVHDIQEHLIESGYAKFARL